MVCCIGAYANLWVYERYRSAFDRFLSKIGNPLLLSLHHQIYLFRFNLCCHRCPIFFTFYHPFFWFVFVPFWVSCGHHVCGSKTLFSVDEQRGTYKKNWYNKLCELWDTLMATNLENVKRYYFGLSSSKLEVVMRLVFERARSKFLRLFLLLLLL